MAVNVLEEHTASIMYPEDMGSRFLWNANSPCTKLQYLVSQNTVMAVVTTVRTRVSYFLIILSQDLHQQYRQGGMWNQNRHIQKICVLQTVAHRPMTLYKLHWSTKIFSHEEKCLSLMYFWTLNSNMFPDVGTPTLRLSFLCPFLSNSVQQHSLLSLSVTPVSAPRCKPSATSQHGTSARVFILLATPTKSAN